MGKFVDKVDLASADGIEYKIARIIGTYDYSLESVAPEQRVAKCSVVKYKKVLGSCFKLLVPAG